MHIKHGPGEATGTIAFGLSDANGLDASEMSHLVFALSQMDAAELNLPTLSTTASVADTLPLTVTLTDENGNTASLALNDYLPPGGFQSRFVYDIFFPLDAFNGVNLSELTLLELTLAAPDQDVLLEVDDLRFVSVVPEPTSLGMLSLLGLFALRRGRRSAR